MLWGPSNPGYVSGKFPHFECPGPADNVNSKPPTLWLQMVKGDVLISTQIL